MAETMNGSHLVVRGDGGVLHCLVDGPARSPSEPPLLLIPSMRGGAELWSGFAQRLAEHRRTLSLDLPGVGCSTDPAGIVTTRRMARDVLDCLDRMQIESVLLFGASLGSLVATWVAIEAPERVERLVLAASAARGIDFSPARLYQALLTAESATTPVSGEDELLGPESGMRVTVHARAPMERRSGARRRAARFVAAALAHWPGPLLGRIVVPTLVLSGDEDTIVSPCACVRLVEALPRATLSLVPHLGHDLVSEDPALCARYVLEFAASP